MNRLLLSSLLLCAITAASSRAEAMASQATLAQVRTPRFRFSVFADGVYEIFDERARVTWRAESDAGRFGQVTLFIDGKQRQVNLKGGKYEFRDQGVLATFHPIQENPSAELRVRLRAMPDGRTLDVSYRADDSLKIESISLLDALVNVTDRGRGYMVVPVREGLLIPADSGLAFEQRFETYAYEGCHMEMVGAVNYGAGLLATWQDPYVAAIVRGSTNASPDGCTQRVTCSFSLRKSATAFQVQVLGKADYLGIGQAYRQIAQARGWVVPFREKVKTHSERAKLFGAANIKLWSVLDRKMNEESTKEESVRLNWTFEEAAQVAEHLKEDLKLDKVLFTIGGWIHRGYDNQHPDILPTAPECGGDAAFAECARRVMNLGYLFCLHDNYQDIYQDSPAWNERYVMKTPEGGLARGGHWAGGLAFLTCSQMALELAQRPQNLPAVKQLSSANAYFIDTTYASGLQECFDAKHPLTRADDMKWKQELSDYGRKVFGVFGSECGREWAIPHSDFFEGLSGVSGTYYHDKNLLPRLGAVVIPLFEAVYRDCIAVYGKYDYDIFHADEYVLQHISLGRPLNYHALPPHLYWKREGSAPDGSSPFAKGRGGWTENLHAMDRFIKNTCEILCPLNEITAELALTAHEFLTPDRRVRKTVYGTGAKAVQVYVNMGTNIFSVPSSTGEQVRLPASGFLVQSLTFTAFYALNWNGLTYDEPAMFTVRSLDDRPLTRTRKARVYHAFGSDQIRLAHKAVSVPKERVLGRADLN